MKCQGSVSSIALPSSSFRTISFPTRTAGALAFACAAAFTIACGSPETPKSSASLNAAIAADATSDHPGSLVEGDAPPKVAVSDEPVKPATLRRSWVKRAVEAGPPVFLQKVELDDRPVIEGGQFRGLRLVALRGDRSFWSGVDIKPGDVVTKVNGFTVQRPEDMIRIFESLHTAKEVRVDYERDGSAKTLAVPIMEDEIGASPAKPAGKSVTAK